MQLSSEITKYIPEGKVGYFIYHLFYKWFNNFDPIFHYFHEKEMMQLKGVEQQLSEYDSVKVEQMLEIYHCWQMFKRLLDAYSIETVTFSRIVKVYERYFQNALRVSGHSVPWFLLDYDMGDPSHEEKLEKIADKIIPPLVDSLMMQIVNGKNVSPVLDSSASVVGSKVKDLASFKLALGVSLAICIEEENLKGRGKRKYYQIALPESAYESVVSGVGRRTDNQDDYIVREGVTYLRRHVAAPVETLNVVVYCTEAYLTEPAVAADLEEVVRIKDSGASYVLVSIDVGAGPQLPISLRGSLGCEASLKTSKVSDWCLVAD